MRTFALTLFLSLFFGFSQAELYAQTQAASGPTSSTPPVCCQKLFEKAGNYYNQRWRSTEEIVRAERELKKVVANCPDYPWHIQAEDFLKTVQEESAERYFLIARYYWDEFQAGKTKYSNGAFYRLNKIVEEYPNYSQIVLVNQLLDEVNKARSK